MTQAGTMKAPRIVQLGLSHSFEVTAGIVWALTGVAYAFVRDSSVHSPITHDLGYWKFAWAALYMAGGPMVVVGILGRHLNIRAAGLILLATGMTMQFIAALTAPIEPRTFNYLIWAVACTAKVVMLYEVHVRHKQIVV